MKLPHRTLTEGAERFRGLWEDEMFARQTAARVRQVEQKLAEGGAQLRTRDDWPMTLSRSSRCSSRQPRLSPQRWQHCRVLRRLHRRLSQQHNRQTQHPKLVELKPRTSLSSCFRTRTGALRRRGASITTMASSRGFLNIQSLNELTSEKCIRTFNVGQPSKTGTAHP